jgi:crossover junction endodeoxyribonuclease RusA
VIRLTLPYPPTSNHNTTVSNGRRISSTKYRAWRREAEQVARLAARGGHVAGPYTIVYSADRPDNRRRDVENLPKSLSDALQAAGVIRDDADCDASTILWSPRKPGKGAAVHIIITPLGEA